MEKLVSCDPDREHRICPIDEHPAPDHHRQQREIDPVQPTDRERVFLFELFSHSAQLFSLLYGTPAGDSYISHFEPFIFPDSGEAQRQAWMSAVIPYWQMHQKAFANGKMSDLTEVQFRLTSAALCGKGVFTTIAIFGGEPFLWDKHWRRLSDNR